MVRFLLWWSSLNVWMRRAVALALAALSIGLLATGHSRLWVWLWCPAFMLFPFPGADSKRAPDFVPFNSAMRQLYAAASYLHWWRMRPPRALEIVKPLHDIEYERTDPTAEQRFEFVKSNVYAVTADCYYHMQQPAEAAHWYRQAAQFRKPAGGFAYLYADMVLRHQMVEEYAFALQCFERAQERWR